MPEYNTFFAGLETGGLRSKEQIILLICYLLMRMKQTPSRELVLRLMAEQGLANYFNVAEALEELREKGNLVTEEQERETRLWLTEKGRAAAQALEQELPLSIREKALEEAERLQLFMQREKEHRISITRQGEGYMVSLSVCSGGDTLLQLQLYAADREQAELIEYKFIQNPSGMYQDILQTFLQ